MQELELRPGMYASVLLAADLTPRLQVPAAAVVYTGPRRLVFVDLGGGSFRPQEVRVGTEANGMYEVLSGLAAGDRVATSGVFLIAAEARISTAAKYWDKTPDAAASDATGNAMSPGPTPMPSAAPTMGTTPVPMKQAPNTTPMKQPLKAAPAGAAMKTPASAIVYSCPMHPEVRSNAPGHCPKCGMNLEPTPSGGGK